MMTMRLTRRHFIALATIATIVASAACGGKSKATSDAPDAGPPRSFMMGISTLPRALNTAAYTDTFRLAAENGEMVLIQRTPPWADFVPGADVSEETAKTSASEKDAVASKHLRLFFAIDPTDGATGRDRLAALPGSLAGKNFGDAAVRSAFSSYAEYVALNYKPAYLALGVEMNLYRQRNKDDFANFESLYRETYDRVKKASPDTQVTVSFQYEDLQGMLPTTDQHFPDWPLIQEFEDRLDVVAISSYPSFVFSKASDIPARYYSQLRGFTQKPIVLAETGYSSAAGPKGINNGTEADQAAFVSRVLVEAENLGMPFAIWFAGWDPAYAKDTPFGVFQSIGLLREDNSEKPAWAIWAEAARRPYQPPSQ